MLIPELCYLTGTVNFAPEVKPLVLSHFFLEVTTCSYTTTPPTPGPHSYFVSLDLSATLFCPALQTFRHDSGFFNHMPLHVLFKGLTDKMRNDFNVMKDLAVHTRLSPEQRQQEVGRLIDYIHK